MTALTLADRLRVYAATSTDGKVTLQMTADQAREMGDILDRFYWVLDRHTNAHFEAQARLAREASTTRIVMWQACYLAAALAFWGIMA